MPLEDSLDPTKWQESLDLALNYARTEDEEGMSDFLRETAYRPKGPTAKPIFRRFAAAAAWLEAEPDTLLKAKQGVTFSDPERAIASLRARQREMDIALGIPLFMAGESSFGAVFAGVAR